MGKNNNIKIMGVFATVLLLVIVITASFAYFGSFNVNLNNNVAVNVNSVSPGNATFTSNATQLNLQVPAANMSQTVADNSTAAASNTATLTVNLTGAKDLLTTCTYDVVYEYDSSSSIYGTSPATQNGDKEITIQVSSSSGTNNFNTEKNFDSTTIASYKTGNYYTLVKGATIESLGSLTTQNINITAKYYNLNISQSSLEGKSFTGKIYVTNNSCKVEKSTSISVTTLMSTSTASVYDENGMRYEGANPNNYVCLDNKTNGACSDSSLQFRIIGLFDEEYSEDGTNSAGTKKLLKVIDTNAYGGSDGIAWNASSTQSTSNNSNSINTNILNNTTKYNIIPLVNVEPGGILATNWKNATLKNELNNAYIANIIALSTVNSKLSSTIANAKWHLGGPGIEEYQNVTANDIFTIERNPDAIYQDNPSSIYAKIGLMYPSDYGYATTGSTTTNKSVCRNQVLYNFASSSLSDCINNNWLLFERESWFITLISSKNDAILYIGAGNLRYDDNGSKLNAYPTFYLDAEAIKIVGGTGTSTDPYHIG